MLTENSEDILVKINSRNVDDASDFNPRYNYVAFYERVLGRNIKEAKYPWYQTTCPFHNDDKPSYFVNAITGYSHCFACGVSKNYYDFVVMKNKLGFSFNFASDVTSNEDIARIVEFEKTVGIKKEPDELFLAMEEVRANKSHEFLFRQPFAMQLLQRDRGLTVETIKRFKIGFMRGTVTIPIYANNGKISSLKFHKKYQTEGAKNQLFPWSSLKEYSSHLVIVEGEFDALITVQNGFSAITQTAGANSWDESFNPLFRRKNIFIAYDNDQAGKEGAIMVGKSLWKSRCDVNIVSWPSFMKNKEDHVDFFVKYKQTAADYKTLLNNAKSIVQV